MMLLHLQLHAACCLIRHALLHATLQMASVSFFTGSRATFDEALECSSADDAPAASGASGCPLLLQTRGCLPPAGGTWSLTSRLCRRSSRCRWDQHRSWCRAKAL